MMYHLHSMVALFVLSVLHMKLFKFKSPICYSLPQWACTLVYVYNYAHS